jgi:hypothetical protein
MPHRSPLFGLGGKEKRKEFEYAIFFNCSQRLKLTSFGGMTAASD